MWTSFQPDLSSPKGSERRNRRRYKEMKFGRKVRGAPPFSKQGEEHATKDNCTQGDIKNRRITRGGRSEGFQEGTRGGVGRRQQM